ncbi:MAG: GerAB/ArcD/ProY family transporter [Candidatus Paraimprobicoccus trichonymphae]|uniref:GerAB/ArcD/ProY family transporter n=1 Tax=Candidatus Paraimprobicoccus trichonymphae TaxID=3033793 RepID=A0AA48L1F5_9FIRM|nr:MAG: GerAB/ArcD/ProY family transporter [Candidatus Paraimprobicoccus trichonymphae]
MERKSIITASQLFVLLFITRMATSIAYNNLALNNKNMIDHILSAIVSFLLTFILIIPVYKLYKLDKKLDLTDNFINLFSKFGYVFIFVYICYFILESSYTLASLNNFISSSMNMPISVNILSVVLILISCYGAYKGLEGLARTSSITLLFLSIFIFFVIFSLFSGLNMSNFKPFLYENFDSFNSGIIYMLSRNFSIPVLGILMSFVRGNIKKSIITWNICVYGFICIMIFLMIGSMGDFLQTQLFPIYTALCVAKIGELQHLDAIYLGVWITTVFIKISLFLLLCSESVKKMFGDFASKVSILIFGFLVVLGSSFVYKKDIFSGLFNINFIFYFTMVVSFVIPVFVLIVKSLKLKGGKKS